MSHFKHIKTSFKNLFYLKKALNRLKIDTQEIKETCPNSGLSHTNLVIPQSNGYDIKFIWNNQNYELVADMDFWQQSYQVNSFINQISQKYANEVIIGESQKIGFQPLKTQSNTLILERWNNK